jgi:hypothetical protein
MASWFCALPLGILAAVAFVVAPSVAGAATPVTPESLTNCSGQLAADSSGASQGEPYLTDYSFYCDTPITGYTVTVDRAAGDYSNVDNYSPNANVIVPGGAISTIESITCEGTAPSNGINCNAGAGGFVSPYYAVQGSVDLVAPYCKSLPAKAKPGTLATPQAMVSIVVTDNTGAEDGPFYLPLATACKKVANTVPAPVKKKSAAKKADAKASAAAKRSAG